MKLTPLATAGATAEKCEVMMSTGRLNDWGGVCRPRCLPCADLGLVHVVERYSTLGGVCYERRRVSLLKHCCTASNRKTKHWLASSKTDIVRFGEKRSDQSADRWSTTRPQSPSRDDAGANSGFTTEVEVERQGS